MATPFNFKLNIFVFPFPYGRAAGVDVKMVDWSRWEKVYIFTLTR
jgi:hypothetical protein